MVVPKLSRPCIIGIEWLEEFRSHVDLDSKTISFPNLEGKPSIRIVNEEITASLAEKENTLNSITEIKDNIKVKREEIKLKIEETNTANTETRKQLEDILWRHRAVFRKEPSRLKSYQHIVRIKENQPFIGRSNPMPIAYREKVVEEIRKMLNTGIIQRSSSPYINPIVPVIKKDGRVRLCLDGRKLNEILLEHWECPEPAEVLFQRCKGIKIISSLDMTSSFWQVLLQAESKKYTAKLVRGSDHVLHGIRDHIISFVDDTLITTESTEQHLGYLEELLKRLEKNNLTKSEEIKLF